MQAKRLESAVWEKIQELISVPTISEKILAQAQALHTARTQSSEGERIKEKIQSLNGQLEVLAERLAQLPKSVSPEPVFRQMERIEELKRVEEEHLRRVEKSAGPSEVPANLASYRAFLAGLNRIPSTDPESRVMTRLVQALIHRIQITPEGFALEHYVGRDHIERGLATAGPRALL